MRFALSVVAASAILAACATATEDTTQSLATEAETSVTEETETVLEQPDMAATDPYLWMEEVEGEAALAWVNTQNDRSLAAIQAEPV
ncbi:MAG: hypothetical protein AAGJ50_08210, partial [Pseudomonadota bacterium]